MMEKLFPEAEPKPRSPVSTRGTIVAPQDLSADYAMPSAVRKPTIASVVPDDPKQMLVELAGNEQVSQWSAAISDWMQQCARGEIVSLLQLQQALEMPLVDIWLAEILHHSQ